MGILNRFLEGAGKGLQQKAIIDWKTLAAEADRQYKAEAARLDHKYNTDEQKQKHDDAIDLENVRQTGETGRNDADNRTLESIARNRSDQPRAVSFGNPVDELGEDGTPVRVQYGNDGTRRVIPGARPLPKQDAGPTKLTEQQSKDLVYYTRGSEALQNLGTGDALASPTSKVAAHVPLIGNKLTGDDYQQADQAGREFLAAVLRKDTGAAITAGEMELYGKTYLPQPFDSADTLQQKADARATALNAIRSGLGNAQSLIPDQGGNNGSPPTATSQPLRGAGGPAVSVFSEAEVQQIPKGTRFTFRGKTYVKK